MYADHTQPGISRLLAQQPGERSDLSKTGWVSAGPLPSMVQGTMILIYGEFGGAVEMEGPKKTRTRIRE